jgi:ABC-type transport system substrate-binding protein
MKSNRRQISRAFAQSLALIVLFSACSPSAPAPAAKPTPAAPAATSAPSAKSTAAPAAKEAAPKTAEPRVERLVFSMPPPSTEGNDPGRDYSSPPSFQIRPMYEYLIGVDAKSGAFIPQLATSWSVEPDGKSYRFKLRPGVRFHGEWGEMTARDVEFSFRNIMAEDSKHGNSGYYRGLVEGLEIVNDYEIVVRLKQPDADFLNVSSELVSGVEIKSKSHFDKMGAPTMESGPLAGTGAYQYKERAQGQYIRFERVPYQHWRIIPAFKELELRWQREASTRLASLQAGEVHLTTLPQDLVAEAQKQGMTTLHGNVPALRTFFSFHCCFKADPQDSSKGLTNPESPLADPRVRQALNKGVNRDELNKAFFGGKAETMILNHFHPTRPGWNPEWERRFPEAYGFDAAKARALLAEAGFGPSKPLATSIFVFKIGDLPEAEDLSEALAGYWRSVGVVPEMINIDPTQHRDRSQKLEFTNDSVIRSTSSHQLLGFRAYNTGVHGTRGSMVEDYEIDALFNRVRVELDDARAADLWRQLGEKAFAHYQDIPLFWLPAEAVVNPRIVGEYVFPGSISGTWTHLTEIKPAS